jgi:hypothetical protein
MTTELEGGEGSASRPGRSLPSRKDPVPFVQEAGWAPGPVWTGAENLAPPGFVPRTVQPVASRYTGYATRPSINVYLNFMFITLYTWLVEMKIIHTMVHSIRSHWYVGPWQYFPAHAQVTGGGDGLRIYRLAANTLNKKS